MKSMTEPKIVDNLNCYNFVPYSLLLYTYKLNLFFSFNKNIFVLENCKHSNASEDTEKNSFMIKFTTVSKVEISSWQQLLKTILFLKVYLTLNIRVKRQNIRI